MRNALTRFPDVDTCLDSWITQYSSDTSTFPHYDIVTVSENEYRIDLAVAGFSRDNLDISLEQGTLTVKGTKTSESADERFVHRGIARRSFVRSFVLDKHLLVTNAVLADGILRIELEREVPEQLKPKQIPIF